MIFIGHGHLAFPLYLLEQDQSRIVVNKNFFQSQQSLIKGYFIYLPIAAVAKARASQLDTK